MVPANRTFILVCTVLFAFACESLPKGVAGPDADALARRMMDSVDAEAWKRTKVITFKFGERRTHLWDRGRQFDRVQKGDLEIFVNLRTKTGVALKNGVRLQGKKADDAVKYGYEKWVNDSFWLTAMNKAFDPGTSRFLVSEEDGDALLVQYASGGVTPGDAYLWHLDDNGRPKSWQLWVSIMPIDGVSVSWEGWTRLRTGAWVSTKHRARLYRFDITEVDGAESVGDLVDGSDPFEVLAGGATNP